MIGPLLDTHRLILRPFQPEDAPDVRRLAGERDVARTAASLPHPYPDGAAEAWIASHAPDAARGHGFTWAMTEREAGALVGAISLRVEPAHRRGELGYWVGIPFWNRGFTTEAAVRVVEYGFDELGLHRLQGLCLPSNVGSVRVLEKAGFTYEGTLRGYVLKWDDFQDRAVYGLVSAGSR